MAVATAPPLITTLSGPLDAVGAAAIEAVAQSLPDSSPPPLIFRMENVSRIDSDGLAAFLHCLKTLSARTPRHSRPAMTFRACPPPVAEFLRLAGFHRTCTISMEEAAS